MKFQKWIMIFLLFFSLFGCEGGFEEVASDSDKADAALQSVTVSVGSLSPAFRRGVTSYTVNEESTVDTLTITAASVKSDVKMQYRIDGGAWTDLAGAQILTGLQSAANKTIKYEIQVTSGDGKGNVIYSFIVTIPPQITLTTTIATGINSTSATGGGNITDDGGLTIAERGVCWSTSSNPTISDSKTTDGSGTGSYSSSLSGLTSGGVVYYVRAYATSSTGSTVYGDEVTLKTCGYTGPGGGLVFYDRGEYTTGDPNGDWRYLEAAPADAGKYMWTISPLISTLIGTTGTAVGTGKANTIAIIAQVTGYGSSDTNYAAAQCTAYSNNGYSDWFLPSKDELHLIYTNLYLLGLLSGYGTDNYHYSSSEMNYNMAYLHGFYWGSGGQGSNDKGYSGFSRYARPVRSY